MILNSKQLEELESIHDVVQEFDDEQGESEGGFDDGAESAFAWRRGMLEKAIANVKKASRRFAEPGVSLSLGTLLFDNTTKRYARVTNLKSDKIQVAYVSGGESELLLKKGKKAEAPAKTASVQPVAVAKSKTSAKESIKEVAPVAPKKAPPVGKVKAQPVVKKAPEIKAKTPIKAKAPIKAKPKAAVKAKAKPKTKAKVMVTKKKAKVISKPLKAKPSKAPVKKPALKKAASTVKRGLVFDPVADPNMYIKQHFKLMSNRELADVTGLSEHTIRRKLGEWGLKRPR